MTTCCTKNLILNNLAVQIDITNINSWNYNNDLSIKSINKWNNAVSDDLNLFDFGLTAFDNGRLDNMNNGIFLTKNDTYLKLYRVGAYSETGNTITYDNLDIIPYTGTSVGNYFKLNGGYFQGFFKLFDYNYEILPPRHNNGITIETLVELLPDSYGIFYTMGLRAEDKYNPFFNGETAIISGTTIVYGDGKVGYINTYSGRTTSEGNYLNANTQKSVLLDKFQKPEESMVVVDNSSLQIDNLKNNIIAFEITSDKRIGYKLLNDKGDLIQNSSPNQLSKIGWTLIDIVFKPENIIENYNDENYQCYPRRKGELIFYINGRIFWRVSDFDEFYFNEINNDKEKQMGVPFNISWGGGSFGLKNSYHFETPTSISIVKDESKNGLLIENYFNNSFIGNVQKLRIYNNVLTSNEILGNLEYELANNSNYNITLTKGGRIINQYQTNTYVSQQTSGSDIRKTIRYRSADGIYKSLFDMLDIKVLIKSRSNPSVEIIKFNKTGGTGWQSLIYVNDYAYDFIVPDTITNQYPNEILFAEIKFQWIDVNDIDGVSDKIFIVNITDGTLLNNTIKNY